MSCGWGTAKEAPKPGRTKYVYLRTVLPLVWSYTTRTHAAIQTLRQLLPKARGHSSSHGYQLLIALGEGQATTFCTGFHRNSPISWPPDLQTLTLKTRCCRFPDGLPPDMPSHLKFQLRHLPSGSQGSHLEKT